MESHILVWGVAPRLHLWTPTLRCDAPSLVYELPRFVVAARVGLMDFNTSSWPLGLGLWTHALMCGPLSWGSWTPALRCGPSTYGYGLPHFGVAPDVRLMDSPPLLWPRGMGLWSSTPWCGR